MALHNTDPSPSDSRRAARGTLQRVRRTLNSSFSVRSYASISPKPSPPLTPASTVSDTSDPSSFRARERIVKPTPFERFLTTVGKRKKGGDPEAQSIPLHQTSSEDAAEAQESNLAEMGPGVSADTGDMPTPVSDSTHAVPELVPPSDSETAQPEDNTTPGSVTPPEATFVARRIQALLATLPSLWLSSQPPPPSTVDVNPDLVPPALASDSRLFSFMCSSSMMNGSVSSDRLSVWSVLDRLGTNGRKASQLREGMTEEELRRAAEEDLARVSDDDNSSLMLCCPIEPTAQSEVEVAQSEIISLDDDSENTTNMSQNRSSGMWSFLSDEKEKAEPVNKVAERKIWVPSTTQLSLEVRWWGYRVYLPPPVLAILDNSRTEASKRAAVLTTALTWLLNHVPETALPPQLRPALQLLKGLIPYLAYIGGFVAWTWGAIIRFDKGNGVILTATWLLPVALIPGTWEEYDVPKSGSPVPTEDAPQSSANA
ncbi:hypothetical protein B0H21DRAFT_408578 [Amylocystis lapponica]|nr:hypothetical protein B0H21DRAFT_408578 [Amylocystis lapponica]